MTFTIIISAIRQEIDDDEDPWALREPPIGKYFFVKLLQFIH